MKLIEAYIPPDTLSQVRELLRTLGQDEIIASETNLAAGSDVPNRRAGLAAKFVPQVKLEIAVPDDQARASALQIFNTVQKNSSTCAVQILILSLDDVVGIETG